MTGGLAWLNDLMTWLARWVPRLTLITATSEGVLFGPGGRVARRRPGLCCYWPITHTLQIIGTRARTLELAAQLHQGEAISVVVGWRVADVIRVATVLNEPEAFLDDRVQAALGLHYSHATTSVDLSRAMLGALSREFATHGIDVVTVDVAQRSWVIPIKNLNDYATHSKAEL